LWWTWSKRSSGGVAPHLSQDFPLHLTEILRSAESDSPQFPLKLEQCSEQYFRARNLARSSNAIPYRFLSNSIPHLSQDFFGSFFLGIGMAFYLFFNGPNEAIPARHHSTGKPMSHPLKNGFNR
jgi:hypothetical protein